MSPTSDSTAGPTSPSGPFRLEAFGGLRLTRDGVPVSQFGTRRLTFLAVLASAGRDGMSRERLAALLWPDSDAERSRAALNQLTYVFRQGLGAESVVVSATGLALNDAVVTSDVQEFRSAVHDRRALDAARLHHAPFLDGLNVANGPLERWIEDTRVARKRELLTLIDPAIEAALRAGAYAEAIALATRVVELDRADARAALQLMAAHDGVGNTREALLVATRHAAWMRDELELEPDPAVVAMAATLRTRQAVSGQAVSGQAVSGQAGSGQASTPHASTAPPAARPASRRASQWARVLATGGVLAVIAAATVLTRTGEPDAMVRELPEPPVMAVLPFRLATPDTSLAYLREGIMDIIGAKLGDGVRAADAGTTLTALRAVRTGEDPRGAVARATEATLIADGVISANGDDVSIDATVYDMRAGTAWATARISGPRDRLFDLVDRVALQLLALGASERVASLPALSGTPISAVRDYLGGKRDFRAGNFVRASAHFQSALAYDSTFALAALELVRVSGWINDPELRARARRLAWLARDRLGVQDRVLLDAIVGERFPSYDNGARKLELWERVTRYFPTQAEPWFELADQLFHGAEFLGDSTSTSRIAALLRAALARDSTFGPALVHLVQHAARYGDTSTLRQFADRARSPLTGSERLFLDWRIAAAQNDGAALARVVGTFDTGDPQSLSSIALASLNEGVRLADGERALLARVANAGRAAERREAVLGLHALAINRGQVTKAARLLAEGATSDVHMFRVYDALLAGGDTLQGLAAVAHLRAETEALGRILARTAGSVRDDSVRVPGLVRATCAVGEWDLAVHRRTARTSLIADLRNSAAYLGNHPAASEALLCAMVIEAWSQALSKTPRAVRLLQSIDSAVRTIPSMGTLFQATLPLTVARLHLTVDRPDLAIAAVRRQGYFFKWPHYRADGLLLEGKLALALGDRASATSAFTRFLALRDAPDERSIRSVDAARAALAALATR